MYFCTVEDLNKVEEEGKEDDFVLVRHDDDEKSTGPIPPLNVLILIVGSRGDVQPFIAFGQGLQKAGHKVRLATHINFRQFVSDEGLDFFPLKGEPEFLMSFMVDHPDMITLDPVEIRKKQEMMEQIYVSTWDACTKNGKGERYRPDVLISNPPVHVHVHLMQRLQVPLQICFTMPWSATKDYMHPLAPMQQALTNVQSYTIVDRMVWLGLGPQQNRFRKETLGLNNIIRGATLVHRLRIPHIYCMSKHLAPKPTDWGSHIDVVGFWFLDSKLTYNPPKDLVDFINAGPKPIYIGFGSIVVANPKKLSQDVINAIKASGQRAIVGSGWAKLGEGLDLPDTIKVVGAVPHEWLFQFCSAVCHHGGAGTTAAGLKAGLPTIVVPFFGDQPFWGACVARMGVGPEPIPIKQLTSEKLAEAIKFCTRPEVQKAAAELGAKIQNENGIATAVEAFHRKLPVRDGKWFVEIHENMRWTPLGWHHLMLPFERTKYTDKTGHLEMDIEKFELPEGWKWEGDWQPDVLETTDKEGWRYGKNFDVPEWHAQRENLDMVRTRRLRRWRTYVGGPKKDIKLTAEEILSKGIEFLIYVQAIEAKDLMAKDISGTSDPFLEVSLKTSDKTRVQRQCTKVIHNNLAPVWKETLWFSVLPTDVIKVHCVDEDVVSNDSLGQVEIPVKLLLEQNLADGWFPLEGKKVKGGVHLGFSW